MLSMFRIGWQCKAPNQRDPPLSGKARSMKYRVLSVSVVCVIATGLAVSGFPRDVQADHIPGHSNDDPIFPVPIPGQEFFTGGIIFITAIGPLGGSEIHNTSFDITYVSDGATPASDLHITVGMMLGEQDPVFVETHVNGTDLGFGSGPGIFQGTFETSALNGVAVESFLFPPYSIVDLSIGAIDGGIKGTGYFVDSFINFDLVGATPGDLNGDGTVGIDDFLMLLGDWGPCAVPCPPSCRADLDGDCDVGIVDFLTLLANWG